MTTDSKLPTRCFRGEHSCQSQSFSHASLFAILSLPPPSPNMIFSRISVSAVIVAAASVLALVEGGETGYDDTNYYTACAIAREPSDSDKTWKRSSSKKMKYDLKLKCRDPNDRSLIYYSAGVEDDREDAVDTSDGCDDKIEVCGILAMLQYVVLRQYRKFISAFALPLLFLYLLSSTACCTTSLIFSLCLHFYISISAMKQLTESSLMKGIRTTLNAPSLSPNVRGSARTRGLCYPSTECVAKTAKRRLRE